MMKKIILAINELKKKAKDVVLDDNDLSIFLSHIDDAIKILDNGTIEEKNLTIVKDSSITAE